MKKKILLVSERRSFFKRRFAFDIALIFSALLFTTTLTIILYTYYKHTQSILLEAQNSVEKTNENAIVEVNGFLKPGRNAQLISTLYSSNLLNNNNINLFKLMKSILITYPQLERIYVGDTTGNTTIAIRVPKNSSNVLTELPEFVPHSVFILQTIRKINTNTISTWSYEDIKGQVLKTITQNKYIFDPRVRPWYQGAIQNSNYWIGMYPFFGLKKKGITVSYPILYQGKNSGVVGVDFNADNIKSLLQNLQIKNYEKLIFIDDKNQLIQSDGADSLKDITLKNSLLKSNGMFDFNGNSYIYSTNSYLTDFGATWKFVGVMNLMPIISEMMRTNKFTLIFSFCMILVTCGLSIFCARRISTPIRLITNETTKLQKLSFDKFELPPSNIIEINEMIKALSSTKAALSSFSKYIPHSLVEKLMKKGMSATLGGEKRILSIMFSDITNFTQISEKLNVEALVSQLSEYLDSLTKIIHLQKGTVDKYLGDGIMAFWGAPIIDPYHVKNACLSALLCREEVRLLNKKWRKANKPLFHTRFGLHTGEVIIGNIGSSDRLNYTAIGDNVNLASRLEAINKQYSTEIIVSQDIVDQVGKEFLFRPLGIAKIKGKNKSLFVYELLGTYSSDMEDVFSNKIMANVTSDKYKENICIS